MTKLIKLLFPWLLITLITIIPSISHASNGLIAGYSFKWDGYNQNGSTIVKANGVTGNFIGSSAGDFNGSTDFVTVSANGNDTIISSVTGLDYALVGDSFTVGKNGASFYTGQLSWFISIVSSNFTAEQKASFILDPKKALIAGCDVWVMDTSISNYINLRTYSEGPELVVNGGFDIDSNWVKGTGVSITGGVATINYSGATQASLVQSYPFLQTKKYKYSFDIVSFVSQGANFYLNSFVRYAGANGTYIGTYTPTNSDNKVQITNPTANYSIDNISVKEVPVTSVATNTGVSTTTTGGTPLYNYWKAGFKGYEFDGVDDYIEFSTGDLNISPNNTTIYFMSEIETGAANFRRLFNYSDSGGTLGWMIRRYDADKMVFTINGVNFDNPTSLLPTIDGNKNLFCFRVTRDGNSYTVDLYDGNGVALGSQTKTTTCIYYSGNLIFNYSGSSFFDKTATHYFFITYPTAHTPRQIKHNSGVLRGMYP